ncbi:MAG: hypothetical protein AB8G96_12620 [Phycisphaerales bacterium]
MPSHRIILGLSLVLAFLAGLVAGPPAINRWLDARLASRLVAADATIRASAWDRWAQHSPQRQDRIVQTIDGSLTAAEDSQVRIDAARRLHGRGQWTPDVRPAALLDRWLGEAPASDHRLAMRVLERAIDVGGVVSVGDAARAGSAGRDAEAGAGAGAEAASISISEHFARWTSRAPDPDARGELVDLWIRWIADAPDARRPARLTLPPTAADDPAARRWHLALACMAANAPEATRAAWTPGDRSVNPAHSAARRSARWVHELSAAIDCESVVDALMQASGEAEELPVVAILASRRHPATVDALGRLDRRDVPGADAVLQSWDPERDRRAADAVARRGGDGNAFVWVLASWRASSGPAERIARELDRGVADPEVPPVLAALVAERRLPAPAAAALAIQWLADPDPRREAAGAILTALLGPDAGPPASVIGRLTTARETEASADVRLVLELALATMSPETRPGPPASELARRTPPDFRSTAGLLLALAGDSSGLGWITDPSPPRPGDGPLASTRASAATAISEAAIARLVPHWHAQLGRPVGIDAAGRRLMAEHRDALRRVEAGRLPFDPERRQFRPPISG